MIKLKDYSVKNEKEVKDLVKRAYPNIIKMTNKKTVK